MPVEPEMKQKVAKRVKNWREHMLEKTPPSGDLAGLNLNVCTVTLSEHEMPAIRTGLRGLGRMTGYQLSRPDHIEETYALIMKHPVIWDAETLDTMVLVRNAFTIFDSNGVYFETSVFLSMLVCSYGERATPIPTADGHTYFVDSYRGICGKDGQKRRNARQHDAPFVEALNTRPTVVIRNQREPKWYAALWGADLQMVGDRGQPVLDLGHVSDWQRLSIAFLGVRGPGKLQVRSRSVAPEIPNELALFMAACTIM